MEEENTSTEDMLRERCSHLLSQLHSKIENFCYGNMVTLKNQMDQNKADARAYSKHLSTHIATAWAKKNEALKLTNALNATLNCEALGITKRSRNSFEQTEDEYVGEEVVDDGEYEEQYHRV